MQYRITILGDRYPTDYTVEASNWGTAINRAIRLWKKGTGKGSRTSTLSVKAIKQLPIK